MKPMNLDTIKQMKVTVPLTLLLGLFWVGWNAQDFTVDVLDSFFISEAEGGELAKKVDDLSESFSSYVSKQTIRDLNKEIREIDDQISDTQLWIEANGANQMATQRLNNLIARRRTLIETKACLLNDNITNKDLCGVE